MQWFEPFDDQYHPSLSVDLAIALIISWAYEQ